MNTTKYGYPTCPYCGKILYHVTSHFTTAVGVVCGDCMRTNQHLRDDPDARWINGSWSIAPVEYRARYAKHSPFVTELLCQGDNGSCLGTLILLFMVMGVFGCLAVAFIPPLVEYLFR